MGVLSRFMDIMSANINSLLDKAEQPEKMIEQSLKDLNQSFAQVKKETASVMAEEMRAKRALDSCKAEIDTLQSYALKALERGNESDAKKILSEKLQKESLLTSLQVTYDSAHTNAAQMQQMHDKLVKDINLLTGRKEMIKAKVATAKAQEHINKVTSSINTSSSISAFERMEEKANRMLDEATAAAKLNASDDSMEDLKTKYDTDVTSVDDELKKLKAQMGIC